ncbi:uncharacterized protein LOC132748860 [Ruditapes philippinarum]|uniref:uncharacterized protein LOC132748860 n=1 Tax=Ruditapes philippinarum TaxID=129788 RepID=UPI00295A8564|nr:uncharacterized protein LOC132748860 [Ruditapes philippinarum]XP_060594507.1 uncharacterized protein LOC132748860 [Ruditapes philippinarum]XP_060594515.1 uncharacterized protein LOC132748860 [Ruditapes philippinarum]
MSSDSGKKKYINENRFRFKLPHRYVIYDKLHRSTVFVLISGSFIICVRMAIDFYHQQRVRKPILTEIARIDQEVAMKKMQAEREATLNIQQKLQDEADTLDK